MAAIGVAGMGVVVGVGGGVGAGRAVFGFRIGSGGRTSQRLNDTTGRIGWIGPFSFVQNWSVMPRRFPSALTESHRLDASTAERIEYAMSPLRSCRHLKSFCNGTLRVIEH